MPLVWQAVSNSAMNSEPPSTWMPMIEKPFAPQCVAAFDSAARGAAPPAARRRAPAGSASCGFGADAAPAIAASAGLASGTACWPGRRRFAPPPRHPAQRFSRAVSASRSAELRGQARRQPGALVDLPLQAEHLMGISLVCVSEILAASEISALLTRAFSHICFESGYSPPSPRLHEAACRGTRRWR